MKARTKKMQKTNIPYADLTWNPGCGCPGPASAGCDNCWARDLHTKRHKACLAGKKLPIQYAKPFTELQQFEDRLTDPLHRRTPSVIAVQFMGDLFAQPFEFIDKVFAVMALCPQHTFLVLTKRAERMKEYCERQRPRIYFEALKFMSNPEQKQLVDLFPWDNVWLGVTAENQEMADKRIPILLQTPAAKRFVSIEPCLGEIDLEYIKDYGHATRFWKYERIRSLTGERLNPGGRMSSPRLDRVIVGGESGKDARPMHPDWARSLRDQCKDAGVPFYFKQWGEWLHSGNPIIVDMPIKPKRHVKIGDDIFYRVTKKIAGHRLDSVEHRPEW